MMIELGVQTILLVAIAAGGIFYIGHRVGARTTVAPMADPAPAITIAPPVERPSAKLAVGDLAPTSDVHLTMDGGNIFRPDQRPASTGIALRTRVWNTGAPTWPTSWSLTIIRPGEPRRVAQHSDWNGHLVLGGNTVIPSSDKLVEKLKDLPIAQKPIEGTLLFYIDMPQDQVLDSATTFDLEMTDSHNRIATFTQRLADWMKAA